MKKLFFISCLLLTAFLLRGEKLGLLADVLRPQALEVEDGRLYAMDGASIYIYSLDDLKLIKKFGRKGNGPGELRAGDYISNSISVRPEYLMVAGVMGDNAPGMLKIVYFTHEGRFVKEKKVLPQIIRIQPVAKNFVVTRIDQDEKGNEVAVAAGSVSLILRMTNFII